MHRNQDIVPRQRPRVIDAVAHRPIQPVVSGPIGHQVEKPKRLAAPRPTTSKRHRLWAKMQLPLLLLAGACGGFFADNLFLGLILLLGYAVICFTTRIASRTTFTLALLLLTAITGMLLVKPSAQLISNFSTYAFVLLLIGVITLGREAQLPKRMPRKYRR